MTITTYQIAGRSPFPIISDFLAYAIERQTMTTPRPTRLNPTLLVAAAAELAQDLIQDGQIEGNQRASATEDIARHATMHMDGYELAKVLEDRCGWACDLSMAEALDGFSGISGKHLAAAQRAWFEAEHPTPTAGIGDPVKFVWGREPRTGVVDGFWEHGVAQFTIKVDGDPAADNASQSRAIVNWEDCDLIVEPLRAAGEVRHG